jgi:hypothetical protein
LIKFVTIKIQKKMKKFYLTLALSAIVILGFSQHAIITNKGSNVTVTPKRIAADRAVGYYYLDYESYDASLGTQELGAMMFNRRTPVYFSPTSTLGMNQAIVVFDTMLVTADYVNWNSFYSNAVQSFAIDTAYIRIYHENNSGNADTLILTIKNVTSTGLPGGTTLWGDTIITSVGLTPPNTGNTYGFYTFNFPVNYTVGGGGKFSFYVNYYGASVDTFGLINSNTTSTVPCAVGTAGNEQLTSEVFPSAFYRFWNNATPPVVVSGVFPAANGSGGLYIDCDGDGAGGLPADWPTEQAVMTWSIWVSGTLTDNTGIDEEEAGVMVKAYPNPAQDFTTIEYTLREGANVLVSITDLTGKIVYSNDLGKRDAGTSNIVINTTELNNGVYMYTLTINNKKVTRRIIVNR